MSAVGDTIAGPQEQTSMGAFTPKQALKPMLLAMVYPIRGVVYQLVAAGADVGRIVLYNFSAQKERH